MKHEDSVEVKNGYKCKCELVWIKVNQKDRGRLTKRKLEMKKKREIAKRVWEVSVCSAFDGQPVAMVTWVLCGASTTGEWRSLEGIDNIAISNCSQVVFIWEGTLEPRGIQLHQDDLERRHERERLSMFVSTNEPHAVLAQLVSFGFLQECFRPENKGINTHTE